MFGDGRASARVVLGGEQPGDQEDRQGRPFVGPAGGVLTRALGEAGIDPAEAYITNAVKHSAVLRADEAERAAAYAGLVSDLGAAAELPCAEAGSRAGGTRGGTGPVDRIGAPSI